MSTRNSNPPAFRASDQSNQSVTSDLRENAHDRPSRGALSPAHGTIDAPIVVVGATGTIGSALVRALVAGGQPVVAVAPQPERLGRLRDAVARPAAVTPIVGRIETDADAAQLADQLRALARPLAGAVVTFPHGRCAVVGADRGRLLDQSTDDLGECLRYTVLAQHALARHLVPLLAESGRNARYLIVGGPGSEAPWAGYGHRSIATAATRMLARVLHDEARASGVRVQLLSIDSPLRGERPADHECPEWPSASDVAQRAARLLDRGAASDQPPDAVVAMGRGGAACTATRTITHAFRDVPSFIASLRHPTTK
jgi:NAD(P)-dependent dehydrogenase (short-subunit alcohol dehydrogenase family)